MAIEIKELHVKLHIGDNQSGGGTSNSQPSKSDGSNDAGGVSDKEAIIQDTVKEVLRILKDKQER